MFKGKILAGLLLATAAISALAQETTTPVVTTNSNVTTNATTTLRSPPPSAISPTINTANSDLCTVGVAGAVQTQILGLSAGKTVIDLNCERLKLSKTLFDMGMKVAAVSTLCQDKRVFDAMMMAGTPCPFDGAIGQEAKQGWRNNPDMIPGAKTKESMSDDTKTMLFGGGLLGLLLLLLL